MSNPIERERWLFFSGLLWGISVVFAIVVLAWFLSPIKAVTLTRWDVGSFAVLFLVCASLGHYGLMRATDEPLDDDIDHGGDA